MRYLVQLELTVRAASVQEATEFVLSNGRGVGVDCTAGLPSMIVKSIRVDPEEDS